jgi:putative oxygen-independent coproporphyrinogen III oxidase
MSETLGLYISVPFCRAKCSYCNFASGVFPASDHQRYVERLCAELDDAAARSAGAGWRMPGVVGSVYLGGGTPSTLEPALLRRMFAAIRQNWPIAERPEITIECAPGQISEGFLEAAVEVGATRVSLGVQSLVDAEAAATGRTHTRAVVAGDVRRLKAAGLRVNLDLIAGLPGQTMASWQQSLDALCAQEPEHASLYMLEVDEDSRLGRELIGGGARYGAGLVPHDDAVATMYELGCDRLERAGLKQYEISNFASPGAESQHNLRYWRREPYLGVGLDAHSMLRTEGGRPVRFGNTDELPAYLRGEFAVAPDLVEREAEIEEAWFLGLRLNQGVSLERMSAEFGAKAVSGYDPVLAELAAEGLLESDGGRVALTLRGRMLSNQVFGRLLEVTDLVSR